MSIALQNKILDKDSRKAMEQLEAIAKKGVEGNMQIRNEALDSTKIATMKEGVPYVDTKEGTKRIVIKVGNEAFAVNLEKI